MPQPVTRQSPPVHDIDRITALERRLATLERTAQRAPSQYEVDRQADAIQELATAVCEQLLGRMAQTIKDDARYQASQVQGAVLLALESQIDATKASTATLVRTAEQTLAGRLDTALHDIRSLVDEKPVHPYAHNITYAVGALVTHRGGTWRCVSRAGNMGEAPSARSQSWSLASDGVDTCTPSIDKTDGRLTITTTLASGRTITTPLKGGTMRHRGGWKRGETYEPLDLVVRSGSTYIAVRKTGGDPDDKDDTGFALVAARGATGPGPNAMQMVSAEDAVFKRVLGHDTRSRAERVDAIIEMACDAWSFHKRPEHQHVRAFANDTIAECIVEITSEDFRSDAEALAQRVANTALDNARLMAQTNEISDPIWQARTTIHDVACLLSSEQRMHRYAALLRTDGSPDASRRLLLLCIDVMLGTAHV